MLKDIERRQTTMNAMSQKTGVNWSKAVEADPSLAKHYRGALIRCTQCAHASSCRTWMDGLETANEAPGYCKNKDLLLRVKTA
ncbi:DUF6455 family protein [Ruegeria atlantica]|uniref:DUF6455 family protein n=1 Tax=Ruegeria atlantica TaxID=81569 RepID=UPI0034A009D4